MSLRPTQLTREGETGGAVPEKTWVEGQGGLAVAFAEDVADRWGGEAVTAKRFPTARGAETGGKFLAAEAEHEHGVEVGRGEATAELGCGGGTFAGGGDDDRCGADAGGVELNVKDSQGVDADGGAQAFAGGAGPGADGGRKMDAKRGHGSSAGLPQGSVNEEHPVGLGRPRGEGRLPAGRVGPGEGGRLHLGGKPTLDSFPMQNEHKGGVKNDHVGFVGGGGTGAVRAET